MDDVVSSRGVANGQTICIDMSTSLLPKGIPGGSADQRPSQDFGVGGTGSLGVRGSQHITDIWLLTHAHFVYLAKTHEPLVMHEKNLGCSVLVKMIRYP